MPGGFKLDERVECRDQGGFWKVGTVVSVEPLKVKPDGWDQSFEWQEVRVSNGIPSGIHSVALSGDKDELEKLLANRAFSAEDVDVKDEDGSTPLMKAVKSGNVECVQILISKGADVSIVGRSGEYRGTALDLARRMKLHRMVDILAATSDGATCEICAEDADVRMRTEWRARSITPGCKHPRRICFSCTRRHIDAEVNQKGNPEIRCPHNECAALLTHADIQHFATSEHFERFDLLVRCRLLSPAHPASAHPACPACPPPFPLACNSVPFFVLLTCDACYACRRCGAAFSRCPTSCGAPILNAAPGRRLQAPELARLCQAGCAACGCVAPHAATRRAYTTTARSTRASPAKSMMPRPESRKKWGCFSMSTRRR